MRFTRFVTFTALVGVLLLAPLSAPAAASKEMQELQRDVAQLQQQMTDLQKALDAKLADITAMQKQQMDTGARTSSTVTNLSGDLARTLNTELKGVHDQLSKVTDLSSKVDNVSSDLGELVTAMKGLVSTVNKQQSAISDISLQIKLLQTTPAASAGSDGGVPPVAGVAPPPTAQALFTNAMKDHQTGKWDLAVDGYKEFLRLYPNDGNAAKAQFNIGDCHYSQSKAAQAVLDFDAVIEQYSDNVEITPEAYYMKGMALEKDRKPSEAVKTYQSLIQKFPASDPASQAKTRLTSLGVSTKPAAAPARGKKRG